MSSEMELTSTDYRPLPRVEPPPPLTTAKRELVLRWEGFVTQHCSRVTPLSSWAEIEHEVAGEPALVRYSPLREDGVDRRGEIFLMPFDPTSCDVDDFVQFAAARGAAAVLLVHDAAPFEDGDEVQLSPNIECSLLDAWLAHVMPRAITWDLH